METVIAMLLKGLGVELTPEQLAQLQVLVPQLPAKVNEIIQMVNIWDARLKNIERMLEQQRGNHGE